MLRTGISVWLGPWLFNLYSLRLVPGAQQRCSCLAHSLRFTQGCSSQVIQLLESCVEVFPDMKVCLPPLRDFGTAASILYQGPVGLLLPHARPNPLLFLWLKHVRNLYRRRFSKHRASTHSSTKSRRKASISSSVWSVSEERAC